MGQKTLVAAPDNRPLSKDQITAQKNLIKQVQAAVMIKDVHFGVIPGCKKNTLYKAGSEAILTTFRIAVDPIVEDLSTPDCFRYRVTARGVLPDGLVVGSGVGECSTDEEKYRWRAAVCSEEYDATPDDRRRIKFSSYQGNVKQIKQVRTNPADLANTALKMAKKRAQIDMTLTATAASDVFDQDLEDLPVEYVAEYVAGNPVTANGGTANKPAVETPRATQPTDKAVTEKQAGMIKAKLAQANVSEDVFCSHYQVASVELLPFAKVNDALKAIAAGEIKDLDAPFEGAEPC